MTNKANSKLSFLRRNLKGCPEKLKQTAYFSLIRFLWSMAPLFWDAYQTYNSDKIERVQRRAARFVKSRYSRYSSFSDMLDVLGWTSLSQRRQEARLYTVLQNILTVWHKCPSKASLSRRIRVLEEKHNMKFRQIGHTTNQYGQSFFS